MHGRIRLGARILYGLSAVGYLTRSREGRAARRHGRVPCRSQSPTAESRLSLAMPRRRCYRADGLPVAGRGHMRIEGTTSVEGIRFDHLTRFLAHSASRRHGLAALVTLFVPATSGFATGVAAERCLRNGRRCGRRSRTRNRGGIPCRFCCTGYARRKRCACRGEGVACNRPGHCCSGECVQGSCSSTCIGLTESCEPETDLCCRSGAVCDDAVHTSGPVCCLPGGFPCDRPSECCSSICDHDTRRCFFPESA
jgi:hypothetical protein